MIVTPIIGYKFRREIPVSQYMLDFAYFNAKLIVELY
ncbi:DUF559 domain-containing protein, partial [Enterobacter intestinihominis]